MIHPTPQIIGERCVYEYCEPISGFEIGKLSDAPIVAAMVRPVRQSVVVTDQVTMEFDRLLNAAASFTSDIRCSCEIKP